MTTTLPPLATAWLDRVDRMATSLPHDRRAELLADLREHLDNALPSDAGPDRVREVLDRMGDPADIVAAAADDLPLVPPPPPHAPTAPVVAARRDRIDAPEIATLVLLVLSGLLLFLVPLAAVAWVVAVVLLVTRDRWVGVENLVALLVPFGFAVPWVIVAVAGVAGATCVTESSSDALGDLTETTTCGGGGATLAGIAATVALVVVLAAAVWAVAWLVRRLDRRLAGAA